MHINYAYCVVTGASCSFRTVFEHSFQLVPDDGAEHEDVDTIRCRHSHRFVLDVPTGYRLFSLNVFNKL